MRIRTVKPEFFSHEGLAACHPNARLLAIGLLCMADSFGRLRWLPAQIAGNIFPFETDIEIDELGKQLVAAGFISLYEVGERRYAHVLNFRNHQRLSGKEAKIVSRLPEPPNPTKTGNSKKKKGSGEVLPREAEEFSQEHTEVRPGEADVFPGTGNREQGTGNREDSSEVEIPPSKPPEKVDPAILTFPCVGLPKTWNLLQSQIDRWKELYPTLDIVGESRKALAWIEANPARKKTVNGMPVFLVRWFGRANDGGSGQSRAPPGSPKGGNPTVFTKKATPIDELP